MDGEAIMVVAAAVVALTSLAKWAGVPDERGPVAVLALSALGVAMWGFSKGTYANTLLFDYFSGWITVSTSAAGVFGFTRAGAAAVTATKGPPPGAGANKTEKDLPYREVPPSGGD